MDKKSHGVTRLNSVRLLQRQCRLKKIRSGIVADGVIVVEQVTAGCRGCNRKTRCLGAVGYDKDVEQACQSQETACTAVFEA